MGIGKKPATSAHEITYKELVEFLEKRTAGLSALDVLAVASNMVGKLLALQDGAKVTPEAGLRIIMSNIQLGNEQATAALRGDPAGHA